MTGLRRLFLDHRTLSAWLVACTLLMKVLVPAGFMPVVSVGVMTLEICGGSAPASAVMAMPGMAHHPDKADHSGRDMPCAFSALTAPSLAATDPFLLAAAVTFIAALGIHATTTIRVVVATHLRPPLRGPPALI